MDLFYRAIWRHNGVMDRRGEISRHYEDKYAGDTMLICRERQISVAGLWHLASNNDNERVLV